jgi:hypothetical protein
MSDSLASSLAVSPPGPHEIEYASASDKINLCNALCKFLADRVRDPTKGAPTEAAERNKMREAAFSDLITSIDVLTTIAQTENAFYDVIDIANKFNITVGAQK